MKEVPKKDQADVSGSGPREIGSCIPPAGPDITLPPDDPAPGSSTCSTMERK